MLTNFAFQIKIKKPRPGRFLGHPESGIPVIRGDFIIASRTYPYYTAQPHLIAPSDRKRWEERLEQIEWQMSCTRCPHTQALLAQEAHEIEFYLYYVYEETTDD